MSLSHHTKAVNVTSFASGGAVSVGKVPYARPKAEEVLVKVSAASVNPIDLSTARGEAAGGAIYPYLVPDFPMTLGWDLAGTIEEVGSGITAWKKGNAVIGMVHQLASGYGSQAERVTVPASILAPWPEHHAAAEVAVLPLPGLTAYQAVDALRISRGDTVLINGPLGAVGSIAAQLAILKGAIVIGVVRPEQQGEADALGIKHFIDRGVDIAQAAMQYPRIDAALDVVGGEAGAQTMRAVKDNGRYVTVIPHLGLGLPTPQRGIVQQNVLIVPDGSQLAMLSEYMQQGKLSVRPAKEYPFEQAPQAYADMATTGQKAVLLF